MIRVGIIGFGYWGPNIVRNFCANDRCRVVKICELSQSALDRAGKAYPSIDRTSDFRDLLSATDIDAVAIVTPVSTHFELAKSALQNGKHVFIEKPFTANSSQAEELVELADRKNLRIMVDHTFLFCGAVRKIKELVDGGQVGKIYYYDSMRVNLGLFQHDVNVIWDLAPHDISIMDYLINQKPEAISATGQGHSGGHEYVAYLTIYFQNNIIAHLNVNWLSPVKVRTTLIGGDKRMLVWNDLHPDEKIRVYDKGVDIKNAEGVYDLLVSYRSGDMWVPKVEQTEALKVETEYFVQCIRDGVTHWNDGKSGYRIVKILEAAEESLKKRGELVYL